MNRFLLCVLLCSVALVSGCGNTPNEPVPPVPPPDRVSDYYTPRSTALRYNYNHFDYRPGYQNSQFIEVYQHISANSTIDGLGSVDQYFLNGAKGTDTVEAYVSDSMVVEYGADHTSTDHRIVLLKSPLQATKTWAAARGFLTPDGRRVDIDAVVVSHLLSYSVNAGTAYNDVYEVRYNISGPAATDSNADYQPGSWHTVYYGTNTGKIEEFSINAADHVIWSNALDTITAR